MDNTILALLIGNLIVSITLFLLWQRSAKQTQALAAEALGLQQASNAIPVDLDKLLGNQNKRIITVEILNPIELATAKTAFAKPLAGMSPGVINKLVYSQARDIIAKQLPDFGVKAEVKVRNG